jgi:hypothetical protein
MALFNTPNLLGHIFQKETFPKGSGIASAVGGFLGAASTAQETSDSGMSFIGRAASAMRAGAEQDEAVQNPIHPIQRKVHEQNIRMMEANIAESMSRRDMLLNHKVGLSRLSELTAQEGFDFSNPDHYDQFLFVAGRYGVDSKAIEPQLKRFETSMEFNRRRDAIRAAREQVGEGAVVAEAGVAAVARTGV